MQIEENFLKALEIAITASNEVVRIYHTAFLKNFKSDGSPVTEADTASSQIIVKELSKLGIPIISEEDKADSYAIRKTWERVWLVDPLDGTKEFIRGNGEFAVNIALIENGQPVFGLIAHPIEKRIVFGGKKMGAFITTFEDVRLPENWITLQKTNVNSPIVMASSRTPYRGQELTFIDTLRTKDEVDFLKKGSALKFFDLAEGLADVYPRFAPTMEWDIASGQAILEGLGGEVINPETMKSLSYNKESLYNPHFIAKTAGFIALFK